MVVRKWLLVAAVGVVSTFPAAPSDASLLAICSAFTPVISNSNEPVRPIEGCTGIFVISGSSRSVTAKLAPDGTFFGQLGMRVRGTNALWTNFVGTYVAGDLVAGEDTRTFTMSPGTWVMEVYLAGPSSYPLRPGHSAIGGFGGSVSD